MNNISKPTLLPPYNEKKDNEGIEFLLKKYNKDNLLEKLISISDFFLGKPYLLGALGEGEKGQFDQSPLYRTDCFDCLTFVNTILALTLSQSLIEFKKKIIALNYLNNTVAYENRCHFISLDWNRHNSIDHPILEDLTQTIKDRQGKILAKSAIALIDKNKFFKHRTLQNIKLRSPISSQLAKTLLTKLRNLGKTIKPQQVKISYIPIASLFDSNKKLNPMVVDQFPKAFVIEMIRPNWNLSTTIGTHLNVSHMGFCFKKNDDWILRHASNQCKKIVDVPLSRYLNQYQNHPTLKGVNIEKILTLEC